MAEIGLDAASLRNGTYAWLFLLLVCDRGVRLYLKSIIKTQMKKNLHTQTNLGPNESQLAYVDANAYFFDDIFLQNNSATRLSFFQHPLCQALWTHFLKKSPNSVLHCIRILKTENEKDDGKDKYLHLIAEANRISNAIKGVCPVLPETALDWNNIKPFSADQQLIVANARCNWRHQFN